MDKVKIKLTNRGAVVPFKKRIEDGGFDCVTADTVFLNMPWEHQGRGHFSLGFITEFDPKFKILLEEKSGYASKGTLVDVWFYKWETNGTEEHSVKVGELTNARVSIDWLLGLIDATYRNDYGAMYKVCSMEYTPTTWSEMKWNIPVDPKNDETYDYIRFVIPKGVKVIQASFVGNPDIKFVESDDIDMNNNRGGGYGHDGTRV